MTKHSPTTARHRIPVAAASFGALATAAVLAATGTAQTGQPATLHLLTHAQNHVGFLPTHRPRPGDQFGTGQRITGDDTGIGRVLCTDFSEGTTQCTMWLHLAKGDLTAQGTLTERDRNTPVAITGGTGAYNGARGTAYVTDISQTSSRVTIQLLP